MNAETNTTVIIDNNYYSIGFPNEKWDEIISRENYISQIENYLDNDTNIIFIEGAEDSGKTTINGIFARKNVTQTVSVFLILATHWILKENICLPILFLKLKIC